MHKRLFRHANSAGNSVRRFRSTFSSRAELLEDRMMLAGDVVQNFENPMDVNGDGLSTPRDAAILAFRLATIGGRAAAAAQGEPTVSASAVSSSSGMFYDVTGDGVLSDADFDTLVESLNAQGEPGDVVTIIVRTTDLSGTEISSVDVGDEFLLQVLVQDTQEEEPIDGYGVFAAFVDVQYDAGLASVTGDFEFVSPYSAQQQGDASVDGLLNEVGAFSTSFTPVGNGELELFSIRMQADAPGVLDFSTNPADGGRTVETLVYGSTLPVDNNDILFGGASLQVVGDEQTAPDLAAFARALDDAGVELWTTTLNARARIAEQLDLFEEGQNFLPIRELQQKAEDENGNLTLLEFTPEAIAEGRTRANVWVFPDGSETNGELLTLQEISDRSGVAIPSTANPSLSPIDDVTVLQGSPLHIPLDGYDPNGDALTYTITIGDDAAVAGDLTEGNRSIRFNVTEFGTYLGDLEFELYETRAPLATERMITLAEDGFYEDIIFHRVINEFVIQSGDPLGNGTGGSDLGNFDDQYHVDLQHNGTGVLSMAKSNDDTNNSQFFITEGPQRALDFNHTIFGQLIEGERVRETISNVATDGDDKPNVPVRIESAQVIDATDNAVLMLTALQATGSTTITVTATDPSGNSDSQTFSVNLEEDTFNAPPFLEPIEDQFFNVGETAQFQISSIDVEGDPVVYDAILIGNDDATIEVDENGLVTVGGFVGTLEAGVQVAPADIDSVFTVDPFDVQFFNITIGADAPASVDLLASSDSGLLADDNITNVTDLQFEVAGLTDGAVAVVLADGVEIGREVASGESVIVTTSNLSALGSDTYSITAAIEIDGQLSLQTPAIRVTLDQIDPATVSNQAPADAFVGADYVFDADHDEEGVDVLYSLSNAPTGMQIDASTGAITWLPTPDQIGTQSFDVIVTDTAGNLSTTSFSVDVQDEAQASLSLRITDADGNVISSIAAGSMFEVIVLVEDARSNPIGVGQAFVDLAFDATLSSVDGAGIEIGTDFPNDNSTGTLSSGELVNVGGSTDADLGGGQFVLATIPMTATEVGTLELDLSVNPTGVILADGVLPVSEANLEILDATVDILVVSTELTAINDNFNVNEDDQAVELDVLANDQLGPDSGTLVITSVSGFTEGGTAEISSDGRTLLYTPAADFNGTEEFTYFVEDSVGALSSAEVTVQIAAVNDPPTANDDFYPQDLPPYDPQRDGPVDPRLLLVEDSTESVFFFVISNDEVAPDSELATVSAASSDTGATLEVVEATLNTNVSYIPGPNVSGTDTFTYTFTDTGSPPLSDDAVVTVQILRRNDAPTAGADAFNVEEGRTATLAASEILANDSAGPLESDQTIEIVEVSGGQFGTAVLNADGSVSYTPDANAPVGSVDTIRYTIRDNGVDDIFTDPDNDPSLTETVENFLESTNGVITITITDGNDAPIAFNDSFSIVANSAATQLPVLSNDTDPDNGPNALSIVEDSITQGAQGGTVTLVDGEVFYEPPASFIGTDTFEYTVTDGDLTSTAQVTVNVTDPDTTTSSSFSGFVYFDVDNDGGMDAGEDGIGGVVITLSGTDQDGFDVSRQVTTNVDGSYRFDSLPKGTFNITQEQPEFLLDGIETEGGFATSPGDDTFTITVGDTIVTSTGNMFAERGLTPRYAILDLLSSNRITSGFMTSVAGDGASQFLRNVAGWDEFSSISVSVSEDASQVTIRGTNSNGERLMTVVDADDSRLRIIGREGDSILLRVAAPSSSFTFVPDTMAAAAVDAAFAGA